jgi:hypothetical protein
LRIAIFTMPPSVATFLLRNPPLLPPVFLAGLPDSVTLLAFAPVRALLGLNSVLAVAVFLLRLGLVATTGTALAGRFAD